MEKPDHVVALFLSFGGSLLLSIGLPCCYLLNNAHHFLFLPVNILTQVLFYDLSGFGIGVLPAPSNKTV